MTNNLGWPEMSPTQDQKYQTANDGLARLDAAITATLVVAITGDYSLALDDLQASAGITLGGSPGGAYGVFLEACDRGLYVVDNVSGQTASVQVDGQAGPPVDVPDATLALVYVTVDGARSLA